MASLYEDIDISTVGGRLKSARVNQNLLIKELAEKSGVTVATIGTLEHNKQRADLTTLSKLSKALNISIVYLGGFDDMPENTLPEKIRKARFFHGHKRLELSKILGVHRESILGWEKQNRTPLDINEKKLDSYLKILEDK